MSEAARALNAEPLRRFKPYQAYKDSGVEWLGKIPAHWEESKVKFLGKYVNGYPFKPEDWSMEGLPIIRIQNLTDPNAPFNRFAGTIDPRYRVRKGDILISWSASLGLFMWTNGEDAWLNQHIFKVQLDELAIKRPFFVWLGDWFIRELQKETHGSTMTHLTWGRFGGFRVDIPPSTEQRAIAAFLDRETARIDALVAKKERLIALLQEQRAALITRAVTKGLDPTVSMKDSGIEWLGEIPAHWEVTRSKNLFALRNMRALPGERQLTAAQQYGVIPQSEFMEREGRRVVQVITGAEILKHVEAKDFVISMRSFQGGIEWSPFTGSISSAYVVLAPKPSIWHPYFVHLFKSKRYIQALQSTSDLVRDGQALRFDNFVEVPLPVIPQSEQRAIAAFLDRETARIDALVPKVRDAIERLKELRTALISAAVTGKIDVREQVP